MSLRTLIAAGVLALAAAGTAHALPASAPGLDVEDRCMAAALRESGWEGALRIRTPAREDRSMRRCHLAAEAAAAIDYVATAKPCLARDLRAWGYRGRIRPPHHSAFTSDDPACAFDYGADAAEFGMAESPRTPELATFRRADGREVTAMRPVPNPEDLPPRARAHIYGRD